MKCMGIENDPEVILMLNEMRKETIQLEQMVQEVCALVVPKRPLIALYSILSRTRVHHSSGHLRLFPARQ